MYRVLVIGRDISHLSSRANLLTLAGYSTDLILELDLAVRRVAIPRYHLVIIGPTFTYDEQIAIRARLRQVRPQLPVLLLGPEPDKPAAFLAAVAHALRPIADPQLADSVAAPQIPARPRR
ncbi:MAG TPA: hypothetical protein VE779_02550 [Candidatus Angelobacter sp.]|nr:hypothetical protein [Candidatus Angelobacter sp.]